MNNNGGTFPNSGIVVHTKNIPIWSQSTFLGNFVTKMYGCVIWKILESGVIISNCFLRIHLALSVCLACLFQFARMTLL